MLKGMLSLLATALWTLSLEAPLVPDEIKGKITKVGKKGEKITVKTKGDEEVTVKISGSRTTIDGVKGRSELKEGQSVTVNHDKGEATKVKVAK